MCGIVAWAGKNPKKFNVGNFTSIGIQNEERGIDSCGVMIDGEIEIGIGETAKFRSFAAKVGIPQPEKIPVVIGHTRKTSVGTIHLRNAHPFGFGKTDLYPNRFIGVHNGTLYNMDDICGKFGVKERQTLKKGQWRKKIDSEMILESLYRSNSYQVLSEYYGLAALVFHDVNEPNVIYAYRGASVKRGGGADDTVYYERPLFYYQETRNSLYISSIKESLYSIGGTDDTVGEFLGNGVYKITDGNMKTAEITKIDRSKAHQSSWDFEPKKEPKKLPVTGFRRIPNTPTGPTRRSGKKNSKYTKYNYHEDYNIHKEVTQKEHYGGNVYFHKFRFYRTGHLVNGVYTYIKGVGFEFMGQKHKDAEATFWLQVGKAWDLDNNRFTNVKDSKKDFIPFPNTEDNTTRYINNPPLYYFYDGVLLRERIDYNTVLERDANNMPCTLTDLSHMSVHPVINIHRGIVHVSEQHAILDGEKYTGDFTVLGADRSYKVINGNLKRSYDIASIKLTEQYFYSLKPGGNVRTVPKTDEAQKLFDLFTEMGVEGPVEDIDLRKGTDLRSNSCAFNASKLPFQGGQFVLPERIPMDMNGGAKDFLDEAEETRNFNAMFELESDENYADNEIDAAGAEVITAELVEKHFKDIYEQLPYIIEEFQQYTKHSVLAKEVVTAIEEFNNKLTTFTTVQIENE